MLPITKPVHQPVVREVLLLDDRLVVPHVLKGVQAAKGHLAVARLLATYCNVGYTFLRNQVKGVVEAGHDLLQNQVSLDYHQGIRCLHW